MKRRKLSTAKKAAWTWLSKCIRYSHALDGIHAACVTCGKADKWQSLDAGHYEPKTRSNALYFHPSNIAPQCTGCNRFRHGNLSEFARWMLREYGQGHLDRLAEMRSMVMNWKACDYAEMADYYREQFQKMQRDRAEGITGKLEVTAWA